MLFGGGLFNSYPNDAMLEQPGKYSFYGYLEKELEIENRSWVWDVNVDNLRMLARTQTVDAPAPDNIKIEFRDFLLQHKM